MNEKTRIEQQLIAEIKEYARGRALAVARGAEAQHLAAFALHEHGSGIAQAVAIIYGSPREADAITRVVQEETERIDPDWRENARLRWQSRPADIVDVALVAQG